ncbi:MAG TPA: hypothetical protein VGR03_08350 [Candidatus Acidoferrum sp.]|nr:hypothetical protein [Candidatus Acidoferrum sp.]
MNSRLMFIGVLLLTTASSSPQETQSTSGDCRIITRADLADPNAPVFEAYRVTNRQGVSKPKLDLTSNPIAKTYRTVLRRDIVEGPNYAGHYRVVVWGCGSSCAMFAVVNLKTGRVITPKSFSAVSEVHVLADDFLQDTESKSWVVRFKRNSKLLVAIGALDEDDDREGAFYFLLEGESLRLIHSTVVKKNCDNTNH